MWIRSEQERDLKVLSLKGSFLCLAYRKISQGLTRLEKVQDEFFLLMALRESFEGWSKWLCHKLHMLTVD